MPDGDTSKRDSSEKPKYVPGFTPPETPAEDTHAGDTIIEKTPPSTIYPPSGAGETIISPSSGGSDSHAGDTILEKTPPSSVTPGGKTPPSSPSRMGVHRTARSELDLAPPDAKRAMQDPTKRTNQYALIQQVGQGGMGSVWKAWDTKLARYVAIKFLNTTDEESVARFEREAQLAARLRHPNIATIYEVNEAKGVYYLAMDFIDGSSIGKAGMAMQMVIEAFVKICRAVDYAHKNQIIHRDIKPQNIMVTKEGEPFVTDFGLAKVLSAESSISIAGSILGTPAYMPPEQATGKIQAIDARSDIYSLGASLYMLVTGHAPFEADNATALLFKVCSAAPDPPRKVNPKVPAAVQSIILKAMEKDKRLRYATAGEMADDLQRHLSGQPVAARPAGALRKLLFSLAALGKTALLVLLLAGTGIGGVFLFPVIKKWFKKPPPPQSDWPLKFARFQERFKFDGFQAPSDEELKQAQSAMTDMPKTEADAVIRFLQAEAAHIPDPVWEKPLWGGRRTEASRIVTWSQTILATFDGLTKAVADKFKPLEERLRAAVRDFETVANWKDPLDNPELKKRYDGFELRLVYSSFQSLPPEETRHLNQFLREMPVELSERAEGFLKLQLDKIPTEVWDRSLWSARRSEAKRIVLWSKTVLEVLEGAEARFAPTRERLQKALKDFQPVAEYVPSTIEGEWVKRFDALCVELRLSSFHGLSEARLNELRQTMRDIPESRAADALSWLTDELSRIPDRVWGKEHWLRRKDEAKRYVDWAVAVDYVLAQMPEKLESPFRTVRKRVKSVGTDFSPVLAFRGKITLRIFILPDADLTSFQVGEEWIVKEGQRTQSGCGRIAEDHPKSPILIEDLDIGDYTVVLSLPGKAPITKRIDGSSLKDRQSWIYGGSADRPEGWKLRGLK